MKMTKDEIQSKINVLENEVMILECKDRLSNDDYFELQSLQNEINHWRKELEKYD